MSRTTSLQVQAILGRNFTTGADLTGFIDAASIMIDQVVACAISKKRPLTDSQAEILERYLTAHYYGHADQFFTSKSTSGASGSFQGQFGKGLEGSQYGQTAMSLDPSGCLKALSMGNKIQLGWLGKNKCDQISITERGG